MGLSGRRGPRPSLCDGFSVGLFSVIAAGCGVPVTMEKCCTLWFSLWGLRSGEGCDSPSCSTSRRGRSGVRTGSSDPVWWLPVPSAVRGFSGRGSFRWLPATGVGPLCRAVHASFQVSLSNVQVRKSGDALNSAPLRILSSWQISWPKWQLSEKRKRKPNNVAYWL